MVVPVSLFFFFAVSNKSIATEASFCGLHCYTITVLYLLVLYLKNTISHFSFEIKYISTVIGVLLSFWLAYQFTSIVLPLSGHGGGGGGGGGGFWRR